MTMCPRHKKQEVLKGKRWCQMCSDNYKRYSDKQRQANRCLCGGVRVEGYRKCAQCRKSQAVRTELNRLTGLCLCGRRTKEGKKGCEVCTEKARLRRAKKKKEGLCQCGRKPAAGSKVCNFCKKLGAALRVKTRAAGLCPCGRVPSEGYSSCAACRGEAMARYAKRRKTDESFVATMKLRGAVTYGIIRSKGTKKSQKTETLLGCTIAFAQAHIERQFVKGMAWSNREMWHIDHYIPCSAFDLTNERQQRLCNNWRNLRPLWKKDNIKKSTKLPWDFEQRLADLEANVL